MDKLLEKVSRLFRDRDWKTSRKRLTCYDFSLSKMPYGWSFNVVNDWHRWAQKELRYEFGCYQKPEYAIQAFLDYVKKNKINIRKLMLK